jgi:outer membrane protein OmpA-like peptidoglycan-associated protein
MKFIFLFFTILFTQGLLAQNSILGSWKGVMYPDGSNEKEAILFYLDLVGSGDQISGKTRNEIYMTDLYSVKKIKGEFDKNKVSFKEFVVESKKSSSKVTWCSSDFKGEYNDSTGYLSGTFLSSTCRRMSGKFVLYRSKDKFPEKEETEYGHAWRDDLIKSLKLGQNAPEIRELERKNFVFQPIYFDHDKAEIKIEYQVYLKEMIRVVNGHSDLRIQITGHTDAVGPDSYNILLSERRAKSIEVFFKGNGLELKKLVIDFKGEKEPVDNNETSEGKQKNRRVDFKFI